MKYTPECTAACDKSIRALAKKLDDAGKLYFASYLVGMADHVQQLVTDEEFTAGDQPCASISRQYQLYNDLDKLSSDIDYYAVEIERAGNKDALKKAALAKLTDEEKEILGIA